MTDETIEKIQKKLENSLRDKLNLGLSAKSQVTWRAEDFVPASLWQLPLPPDPELQSVKDEIEDLKEQRRRLYDILQAAASIPPPVPVKEWSKSPFYSHTLKSWNFDYSVDQMGFYVTTLIGIGIVSKALWRSRRQRKYSDKESILQNRESLTFICTIPD